MIAASRTATDEVAT